MKLDKDASNVTIQAITATYDPVGSKASQQVLGEACPTTYTMDAKDRVVGARRDGGGGFAFTYAYDNMDNTTVRWESGAPITTMYDVASRVTTAIEGSVVSSFAFDPNGNQTVVDTNGDLTTMGWDKENRSTSYNGGGKLMTSTYDGDGYKRSELRQTPPARASMATLIWDGSTYLGEQ